MSRPSGKASATRLPDGKRFLELEWAIEDLNEVQADIVFGGSKSARQCLERLGRVLRILYAGTTCHWKCPEDKHVVEGLTGRGLNHIFSAIRLIRFGLVYDALAAVRSLIEIACLIQLFNLDDGSFERWQCASLDERRKEFSPSKVRQRLGEMGVPTEPLAYGELSEISVHANPLSATHSFAPDKRRRVGGWVEPVGMFVAFNQLSAAAAVFGIACSQFLRIPNRQRLRLSQRSTDLGEAIGGVNLESYREIIGGGSVVDARDGTEAPAEEGTVEGEYREV